MASPVSFDVRAMERKAQRALDDAAFAASMNESFEMMHAWTRIAILFAKIHAPEIFGAAGFGTALSVLAMWQGWV
jgi:hypothetical protein